jgi:hypothetical protein
MDASIRLYSGDIDFYLEKAKQTGYLSIYLAPFSLVCYTHPKTFEWFEENPSDFKDIYSMEVN